MQKPRTPRRASPPPEERPSLTPERNLEAAMRDSFPASDAPAPTAVQGVRATPPQRMMERETAPPPPHSVPLVQRFPDAETAKLALEALVREGPVDRAQARITRAGSGRALTIQAGPEERGRLADLLRRLATPRQGGA